MTEDEGANDHVRGVADLCGQEGVRTDVSTPLMCSDRVSCLGRPWAV